MQEHVRSLLQNHFKPAVDCISVISSVPPISVHPQTAAGDPRHTMQQTSPSKISQNQRAKIHGSALNGRDNNLGGWHTSASSSAVLLSIGSSLAPRLFTSLAGWLRSESFTARPCRSHISACMTHHGLFASLCAKPQKLHIHSQLAS